MVSIRLRVAARTDLVDHFDFLEANAGMNVAERFLLHAEATFNELARQPGMGAMLKFRSPALDGIRKWRIRNFDNHLVFYMPRKDKVSILRVLHSATDWWKLLGNE